jgi:hypothetical protein
MKMVEYGQDGVQKIGDGKSLELHKMELVESKVRKFTEMRDGFPKIFGGLHAITSVG